eukprot:1032798-Pleurochrysis_carterae.AAC.1
MSEHVVLPSPEQCTRPTGLFSFSDFALWTAVRGISASVNILLANAADWGAKDDRVARFPSSATRAP